MHEPSSAENHTPGYNTEFWNIMPWILHEEETWSKNSKQAELWLLNKQPSIKWIHLRFLLVIKDRNHVDRAAQMDSKIVLKIIFKQPTFPGSYETRSWLLIWNETPLLNFMFFCETERPVDWQVSVNLALDSHSQQIRHRLLTLTVARARQWSAPGLSSMSSMPGKQR